MNHKRYRKIFIFFTVIFGTAAIFNIAYYIVLLSISLINPQISKSDTVNVIGSADGPTTIFVADLSYYVFTAIVTVLSIIGITYLIITKRK